MELPDVSVRAQARTRDGRTVSLRTLDEARMSLLARLAADETESAAITAGLDAILNRPGDVASWEVSYDQLDVEVDTGPASLPEPVDGLRGDWDVVMYSEATLDVPVWWSETPGCPHPDGCGCGPASLGEVILGACGADKTRLVSAHMELLVELGRHYDAALALAAGELSSGVCVGCIADTDVHLGSLETALANTAHDLAQAFGDGQFGVRA